MARYFPPRSIEVPWKVLVLRKDPDYERQKRDQLEYQFSNGRQFRTTNPDNRGAYADED
jgi:hypothetical protein